MSANRTAALAGVLYLSLDVAVGALAGAPPALGSRERDLHLPR